MSHLQRQRLLLKCTIQHKAGLIHIKQEINHLRDQLVASYRQSLAILCNCVAQTELWQTLLAGTYCHRWGHKLFAQSHIQDLRLWASLSIRTYVCTYLFMYVCMYVCMCV